MPVRMKMGAGMPQPGSIIRFGNYPFVDNDDDFTPLEWLVLQADGQRMLLLSRYALNTLPPEEVRPGERQSEAAARWMNTVMLRRIFGWEELKALLPEPSHESGYERQNKLFLFTQSDVSAYLDGCEMRRAELTDYAAARGAFASEETGETGQPCSRWLLNEKHDPEWETMLIDETGALTRVNGPVKKLALRPAVQADWSKARYYEGPNDPADKFKHVLLIDHFF